MKNNAKVLNKLKGDMPANYSQEALTATADGVTPTIKPETDYVEGTGVNGQVAYLITLPAPIIGKRLTINNASGYTFCIQSNDPTTVGINNGKGVGVKLSIATAKVVYLDCISNTNWVACIGTATAAS